jgi:hypothetical protein
MASDLLKFVEEIDHEMARTGALRPEALEVLSRAYWSAFQTPEWVLWFVECVERARIAWYQREQAGLIGPDDVMEFGRAVLRQVRAILGTASVYCPLLPAWLAAELTALFIQRFSFGRGGGPERAISRARFLRLLQYPAELAAYLRASKSMKERFSAVLAELDRVATDADAGDVDMAEAGSTTQVSIKAARLRQLAEMDPIGLALPDERAALHRAYDAIFTGQEEH